jgi:hypothetical protein
VDKHARDASEPDEVVEVTDRQHRRALHGRDDGPDVCRVDARDVQEVAGPQRAFDLDLRHGDGAAVERATLDAPCERLADGRITEYARGDGGARRQRVRRPVGEFREVVDEAGLGRGFRDILRSRGRRAQQDACDSHGHVPAAAHTRAARPD